MSGPSRRSGENLVGRVVVLSPHLDDAVLSLGAAMSSAARAGADVTVVTVLAGDPESTEPAGPWDSSGGFTSAAEAAVLRRGEDRRACDLLGVRPTWLPFGDEEYERGSTDEEIWSAIAAASAGADAMLLPGFPLVPADHVWLTELVLSRPRLAPRVGLYVEEPYAAFRHFGRGGRTYTAGLTATASLKRLAHILLGTRAGRALQEPDIALPGGREEAGSLSWFALASPLGDRRRKHRALAEYVSQLPTLGRLTRLRVALYERAWGGEGLAWLDDGVAGDA